MSYLKNADDANQNKPAEQEAVKLPETLHSEPRAAKTGTHRPPYKQLEQFLLMCEENVSEKGEGSIVEGLRLMYAYCRRMEAENTGLQFDKEILLQSCTEETMRADRAEATLTPKLGDKQDSALPVTT